MDKTFSTKRTPLTLKGLTLVILVHALAIWALSSGMGHRIQKLLPSSSDVALLDTPKAPPPPPPVIEPPTVRFDPLPVTTVPVPVVEVSAPQDLPRNAVTSAVGLPATGMSAGGASGDHTSPPHQATVSKPLAQASTMCSQMGKPELPAVNWQGVASFKVHAKLSAGRVSQVTFVGGGAGMDGKTRRLMQRAIETALLDTYRCQGDGSFEQEFLLRIED